MVFGIFGKAFNFNNNFMKKEYEKIGKDKFKITTQRTEENYITMEEVENNLKHITERLEAIENEKVRLKEQKIEQQKLKDKLKQLK